MGNRLFLWDADWLVLDSETILRDGAVVVDGTTIREVGPSKELRAKYKGEQGIDCSKCIVIPGLINAHNHVYENLCRGLGKEYSGFEDWLRYLIYPVNRNLTGEDFYWSAQLACAEAFRTGTTAIVEQMTNFARFQADHNFQAFLDAGMRGAVARGASTRSSIDKGEERSAQEDLDAGENFIKNWQSAKLVQPWLGPSGLFCTDEDTLLKLKKLTLKLSTRYHIHLNETLLQANIAKKQGYQGEVDWGYRIGLLDESTSVAHAVWANHAEIEILKRTQSPVVHNPSSNQVLASGVANIPLMIKAGVPVALGSDGPASNDSMDMIAEMKSCVLLHRVTTLNADIIFSRDAFKMATEAGEKVLGERVGKIRPDFEADLAIVDLRNNPCLTPVYDPIDALVYYGSGRDVKTTIVNGKLVYEDGKFTTIDIEKVIGKVSETAERIKTILSREKGGISHG
ncbi:MAG: amidohydrolase [Candidatus Helarchaeota archaeon]|nr:amidohydrolase [Candidatus Helarchaeota archaeon]